MSEEMKYIYLRNQPLLASLDDKKLKLNTSHLMAIK